MNTNAWIALLSFVILGIPCRGFDLVPERDQNAILYNDRSATTNVGASLTSGDFNGDGKTDLAVGLPGEINLFLGGVWESVSVFSSRVNLRVILPASTGFPPRLEMTDMNGDGKDDLLFSVLGLPPPNGGVWVVLGRGVTPALVDLTVSPPDLKLEVPHSLDSFAVGDFNGDHRADVGMGSPYESPVGRSSAGMCFAFLTPTVWTGGTISVDTNPLGRTVYGRTAGDYLGDTVLAGDLDGDGKDELICSAENAGDKLPFVSADGEIDIFSNVDSLPAVFDLQVSSPDLIIRGYRSNLKGVLLGDVNGDHLPDLWVSANLKPKLINGVDLSSGAGFVDMDPNSTSPVSAVPLNWTFANAGLCMGDFDGDTRKDVFFQALGPAPLNERKLQGYLSSSEEIFPFPLVNIGSPSLTLAGAFNPAIVTDLNGDGFDDLIVYGSFDPPRSPGVSYGAVEIFFGFQPLFRPTVRIQDRVSSSLRAVLEMGVMGRPAEMMCSGDVDEKFRGRWFPFQPVMPVDLSPSVGAKTVRVLFRDAAGRMSEEASVTASLTIAEEEVRMVTNVLVQNSSSLVRAECSFSQPGRLKGEIYTRDGEKIVTLAEGDRTSGVWPLEWDGTNTLGDRVSPGLYLLVVNKDGRVTKHKIVVRG